MSRIAQWMIFIVSLLLMGLWFPFMFFRADEKHLVADNFGLNVKDADGYSSDGVEEAFQRVGQSPRIFHDLKNVSHEWAKGRPKLAVKFLMFVILILCAAVATLVI